MSTTKTLTRVPTSDLMIDDTMLRAPNKEGEKWSNFVESIKQRGILQPLLVREHEGKLIVIDGGHRLEAARDLRLDDVPVMIIDATDQETLILQIQNNLQRFETKPAQYAKHLKRLLRQDSSLSVTDLAKQLNVSNAYVFARLQIASLPKEVQSKVDDGSINVTNAAGLGKLFNELCKTVTSDEALEELEESWVDKAANLSPTDLSAEITGRVEELRKERAGRHKDDTFTPVPKARSMAIIRNYCSDRINLFNETYGAEHEAERSGDSYERGVIDGLKWAITLSDEDVIEQKQKYNERKLEKASKQKEKSAVVDDSLAMLK